MGIGYRIKEARERLGLTQTELGKLVGVTGSAITNYEKETSHPKEQVIYKLMECLDVDANYLFQDVMKISKKNNDISLAEYEHIKKYRALDLYGQNAVIAVLVCELNRCREQSERIADSTQTSRMNIVRIAGRNGDYTENHLTDEQIKELQSYIDQLPNPEGDL